MNKIWEINIPGISLEENPDTYNVSLVVPASFGEPTYVYPLWQSQYFWTLPSSSQGITLAFGKNQQFSFKLNYHLENPDLLPGLMEISLPSDS